MLIKDPELVTLAPGFIVVVPSPSCRGGSREGEAVENGCRFFAVSTGLKAGVKGNDALEENGLASEERFNLLRGQREH